MAIPWTSPNDSDHSIKEITAAFEVLGQHVVHIDVIKAPVSHLTLTTTFTKDRLNRCKMTKDMMVSRTLRWIQSRSAPTDTNSHMTVVPTNRAKPQVQNACQLALAARKALGCRDAGRIDTRFDQVGEVVPPCISEINPFFWNSTDWSDLALIATSNGLPFDRFLKEIINCGWSEAQAEIGEHRIPKKEPTIMSPASCLSQWSLNAIDGRSTKCGHDS